jgi:hypothetical protein
VLPGPLTLRVRGLYEALKDEEAARAAEAREAIANAGSAARPAG